MIDTVLAWVAGLIIVVIERSGYVGITLLSAVESANIPVPSEVVVPFAGFLAFSGAFSFLLVVLTATLGNVLGSWFSYELGLRGGRAFLTRYGRWFLILPHDMELADRLFARYGNSIVFFSRMLPIIRTFISFPAGVARMPRAPFLLYTFAGALPWNFVLAYLGFFLGENWHTASAYFRTFDWLIVGIIVVGVFAWIFRHRALFIRTKSL